MPAALDIVFVVPFLTTMAPFCSSIKDQISKLFAKKKRHRDADDFFIGLVSYQSTIDNVFVRNEGYVKSAAAFQAVLARTQPEGKVVDGGSAIGRSTSHFHAVKILLKVKLNNSQQRNQFSFNTCATII